jgi:hypothetical protein
MDTDDAILLTLAVWIVLCSILVGSTEVFVTLILIGLLVVAEVAGNFISPESKQLLKPAIYFLLFVFLIIVVRRVIEVLS